MHFPPEEISSIQRISNNGEKERRKERAFYMLLVCSSSRMKDTPQLN